MNTIKNRNQLLNNDNRIIDKIYILFVSIAIVYNSGSALITVYTEIGILLLAIAFVGYFIRHAKSNNKFITNKLNISFVIMIGMVAISFIVNMNFEYVSTNARFILIISFAYIFVKHTDFNEFIKFYLKTMKIIILLSLIPFYLMNHTGIDILQYLPIIENSNGAQFYNGLIFFNYTFSQSRNMGVFWEPSIFSSLIIIAMVYEIFFKGTKPSNISLIIFTLGLLTSQSTGGYFLFILVIILYGFRNAKTVKTIYYQAAIVLMWLWSYINYDRIILQLVSISPTVFNKMIRAESASISQRNQSPIENIKLFFDNPIFGLGLGKIDLQYSHNQIVQTSTSTYYLAAFGILGILYAFLIIYGLIKQKHLSMTVRIIIMIIIFVIINKEPYAMILTMHIILFYFIKENHQPIRFFRSGKKNYKMYNQKISPMLASVGVK